MDIKWKSKRNSPLKPDVILNKLDSIKSINTDGKVSFKAFDSFDAKTALFTMIDFGSGFSSYTKEIILRSAIYNVAEKGKLTPKAVLNELRSEARKLGKQREKEFSLLTTISINPRYRPIKILSIEKCKVRFLPGPFPKKYNSRKEIVKRDCFENDHTPKGYCRVIISTKGKLTNDIVHNCMEALDLLRAILCILVSEDVMFFGLVHKPINKVMTGKVHTLHYANGKLAEETYWYEANFQYTRPCSYNEMSQEKYAKNIRWAMTQISKIKYKSKIKDALIRYVRAFDECDKNTTILKGWNVMEALLSSGNNCENVSKRCSFLYEEANYHKQIIEHLREYRNTSIHAGEFLSDATKHCYQLQRYIIAVIIFHLNYGESFDSLDDANCFLDLPPNVKELESRKGLIDKAIKYITASG